MILITKFNYSRLHQGTRRVEEKMQQGCRDITTTNPGTSSRQRSSR